MKLSGIPAMAKKPLRLDWEVCLLIVIGLLLLVSLQVIGATSEKYSQYPLVRALIGALNLFRQKVLPIWQPIMYAALAAYLLLPLSLKLRRAMVDFFMLW